MYTGKSPGEAPEKNQGMRVVLDMAEGLNGHNITCDNFFTSYALGEELLKRKVTMLGTVRKNIKTTKRSFFPILGQSVRFYGDLHIFS